MPLEIFENIVQGTPEWISLRLGLPTASCFGKILAKGEGKTRAQYMRRIAGEILTGEPAESFVSNEMVRGTVLEPEARAAYALITGHDVYEIGFGINHGAGASPDGLIGTDGAVEFKAAKPEILLEIHERGVIPPEHVAQCQGVLWVLERQWIDFVAYWPKMKLFITRIERNPAYIATLAAAVKAFQADVAALVERHRA